MLMDLAISNEGNVSNKIVSLQSTGLYQTSSPEMLPPPQQPKKREEDPRQQLKVNVNEVQPLRSFLLALGNT